MDMVGRHLTAECDRHKSAVGFYRMDNVQSAARKA